LKRYKGSKLSNISQIAVAIIALIAIVVSIRSCQIAERSYEVSYQSNLPIISAINKTYYNEEEGLHTDKIIVTNGGGPLKEFRGYAYAIMEIEFADKDIQTYVPLGGYFVNTEYTGNSEGLLLTTFSENNSSDYWSIAGSFREAALKDGYEPLIWNLFILSVYYNDYSGQYWTEYFMVGPYGSHALEESYAKEILDSSDRSKKLAESKGLGLYIWELNGQELWDWYKEEILENQPTP
jgi:hypothetical protein